MNLFKWLLCWMIIIFHACAYTRSVISYFRVISFFHCLWKFLSYLLTIKGWSGGNCYPYGAIWRGNWLYLLLRGLISSYWTNANFSFLCADSLGDENLLWSLNLACYLCFTTPLSFEERRTKVLSWQFLLLLFALLFTHSGGLSYLHLSSYHY